MDFFNEVSRILNIGPSLLHDIFQMEIRNLEHFPEGVSHLDITGLQGTSKSRLWVFGSK